jgi:hypothetical protein
MEECRNKCLEWLEKKYDQADLWGASAFMVFVLRTCFSPAWRHSEQLADYVSRHPCRAQIRRHAGSFQ